VINGHIDIPDISLSAYGFGLSAHNISLGNQGLSVGSATLDLAGLGLGNHSLSVSGLRITPSFHITGGTISVDGSTTLSLSYFDATLTVSNLSFVSGGIGAASVSLALPEILGGKTLTLDGLTIGFDGRISGQLVSTSANPLSIGLSDFNVGADRIAFDSKGGITVTNAMLNLPIFQGGLSVGNISYDGHALQFSNLPALPTDFTIPGLVTGQSVASIKADCKAGGGTFLPLPPISAGGFSVSGSGCLNFGKDANGHTTYDIIGRGSVSLAKIGSLNALVEIGSIDDDHPSNLRHAALDVQIAGAGIPIDETGLEINGINGVIYITGHPGAPIYTFQVGLDFQTDDGGFVFKGEAHATFASDGNFGIGGSGTFFTLLPIAGGFCVRLVAKHDFVCQSTLTHHGAAVDASNGVGLYAEISSDLVFHVNKDISFHADAYGHIWIDSDGPELTASADISLNIPKDAFATLIPPCGLSLAAGVAIGRFSHGSDTVRGIKGYFDADICDLFSLSENVFIDSSGGVHVGSAGDYTLIDAGNGTAYLLARLSDGQLAIRRVHALAKPLAPAQVVVPVTVKPGQTATDFVLSWRHGAPSITLTAPDGATYTPTRIGAGNTLYTAQPSDLSPGFVGGEALYLRRLPAGLWHVTIGNLRGGEGYRLLVQGKTPPAALTVDAPAAGQTLTAAPTATLSGTLAGDGTGALLHHGPHHGHQRAHPAQLRRHANRHGRPRARRRLVLHLGHFGAAGRTVLRLRHAG